jgi:hypothetical protein
MILMINVNKYEENTEKKGKGLADVAYGVNWVRGVNLDESEEVEGCCGLSRNMAAGGRETTELQCCRLGQPHQEK